MNKALQKGSPLAKEEFSKLNLRVEFEKTDKGCFWVSKLNGYVVESEDASETVPLMFVGNEQIGKTTLSTRLSQGYLKMRTSQKYFHFYFIFIFLFLFLFLFFIYFKKKMK